MLFLYVEKELVACPWNATGAPPPSLILLADPYKNLTTVFPEFYCTILSRIGTVGMETSVSNMIITTKV